MEKQWFILHQSQKFGPFARQQVLEMLKTGSILRTQKVWRDGMDEPITSYELFLDSVAQPVPDQKNQKKERVEEEIFNDMPPPLPPLPPIPSDEPAEVIVKSKPSLEKVIKKIENPAEKEEVVLHKEIAAFKKLSGQEVESMPPLPPDVIRYKTKKKKISEMIRLGFHAFAAICILLILYIVLHDIYLAHIKSIFKRPSVVDIKDSAILKSATQQGKEKLAVALMNSKDALSIVLSSNFIYDASISLDLIADHSRVLSSEPIHIKSSTELVGGQAHFSDLTFIKGSKLYPGYYKVKLNSSQEKRDYYWYDRLYNVPQKIVMEDLSIFLGHLPVKIFNKKLKRYIDKRQKKEQQFTQDLSQKWATLSGIVNQLRDELLKIMGEPATIWKTKVEAFEQKYTRVFGSFFTEFYLNNEQVLSQLEKSNVSDSQKIDKQYRELSDIAKSLGQSVAAILDRASGFKIAPNQESRADLTTHIIKNMGEFEQRIEIGESELKTSMGQSMDSSEDEDLESETENDDE